MSAQPLPLYLRRYQVEIGLPGNNITVTSDKFEPDALRCTFDIQQRAFQTFWVAEIALYNLAENTISDIMSAFEFQTITVTVQAGYVKSDQGYGVIWTGIVFQPLFTREGVVDTKLTLSCVVGLIEGARNFVSQTLIAGLSQADIAKKIAEQAFTKIPIAKLSSKIKDKPLPRGKVVFGSPRKYFTQIAEDNNMQWWLSAKGITISGLTDDDIPAKADLTFTPPSLPVGNAAGGATNPFTPGDGIIIGTPQQTPYGVIFRALIDSRVQVNKPFIKVKIDNSQIRKMKLQINPGQTPEAGILDRDGEYIVVGTRFIGDTRGNDWYVEVDGFTSTGAKVEMMKILQANSNGA